MQRATVQLLFVFALATFARADAVRELWAGYDPRAEPLEIELTKSWDEGPVHFESLFFTGETWDGKKIRVFAYRGTVKSEKSVPGILHVHGGGQTASLEWVRFWTKRGYACVSHDFAGKWNNRPVETITDWGDTPGHHMGDPAAAKSSLRPTPKHSAWYHWTLVSRRALTLLEKSDNVDPDRLGVFGISVGGTLTWMVAGTDDRVKAAVPIYGVGQNTYTTPWQTEDDPVDPDTRLARQTIEPEAYAPFVTCPLLFMNASNDHHGRLDLAMRTLALTTKSPTMREVYTPRFVHHIEPSEGRDLPMWMDLHLKGVGAAWPVSPKIEMKGRVVVTVDRPAEVESVRVHYGLNNPWPVSRFYRTAVAAPEKPGANKYVAPVKTLADDDTIYAFANVAYRNGITLSTRLAKNSANDLSGQRRTLKRTDLIDPMTDSEGWLWWRAGTDPWDETKLLVPWTGPAGERGFANGPANVFSIATFALGDDQFRREDDRALLIDLWAETLPKSLEIEVATQFFQPPYKSYKSLPRKLDPPAGRWLTVRIVPSEFVDASGVALKSWKNVDFLWLTGTPAPGKPAIFANLRWETAPVQDKPSP